MSEEKQWYVMELNGCSEEEAMELINHAFANMEWEKRQSMGISHLTERGVADLKKHVFRQGEAE